MTPEEYLAYKKRLAERSKKYRDAHKEHYQHYEKFRRIHTPEQKAKLKLYWLTPRGKWVSYRGQSKRRGLVFELARPDFDSLVLGDCHYCGSAGPGGIDRQDSTLGYTLSNCVSCCAVCNTAKNDLSLDQFYAWIRKVAARLPCDCI